MTGALTRSHLRDRLAPRPGRGCAALCPAMGGGYRAAVLSSGFVWFGMGATPTAIANMTAVAKRYGPSPMAFVVLPLVSAFFADPANAFAIRFFLTL